VTIINLYNNVIGVEGALALADALKFNTSVTNINLGGNQMGAEGALALADALQVNTKVSNIDISQNGIGAEGALVIADALKFNTSVTNVNFRRNGIGNKGASALANSLKVNTSVTTILLGGNAIGASNNTNVNKLLTRNERLRQLFLFDARQMLLSVMCADECGVVWPYLLDSGDTDGIAAPAGNVETLRAEFAAVVEERRRRGCASSCS
jgi:Ran GTPase-activating protein (RanGAP) involved in mRNA processing and transport